MNALTLIVLGATFAIGLAIAAMLYRASLVKRKLSLDVFETRRMPEAPKVSPQVRGSVLQEKIRSLPLGTDKSEKAVKEISKLVEEQAENLVQDLRQEYSVKYQVVVQQKNKEVENAMKNYKNAKDQYQQAQKMYKDVDTLKRQTEAVVKSIAEGVVVVNKRGEVLLMNPSAEKLLGKSKQEVVGKPLVENTSDQVVVSLSRETGTDDGRTMEIRGKDENIKKIIRSSGAVIQNEDGDTVGMVNILTDVTKQKELDEIKTKFISNVTHELRTPIVAMQKAMQLLQTQALGPLNEAQANFMGIISRNMGHLNRLVEDLLDIAKIDSGKMRVKMVPSKIDKVISDTCDSLDTWAKSKSLQIVQELDRTLPIFPFDPDKVVQVLNNLIGNAIKFTPSGGKITVKSEWDPGGKAVKVSVIDTGVGIAKENISKLFGRFEQFGDQQGITGTGLGLSICREIVDRHSGKIWVESELGKGAKFIFTLPSKQLHTLGS